MEVGATGRDARAGGLLIHNVRLVDPAAREVYPGCLLAAKGRVAAVSRGAGCPAEFRKVAGEVVDGGGRLLVPGLLDVHTHIESSLVTPSRFAEAVLPHGTTTVVADPHEIANVCGEEGVRYLLAESRGLPLRIYFAVPSCVPATSAALETSGAEWGPAEVDRVFRSDERFIALGEMMDFRAVVEGESRAVALLKLARERGWLVEGHCPTLTGAERAAYFAAGISTDHTLMTPEKIRDEHRLGVWVELQERSITAENVATLLALDSLERVLFVTDDFPPSGFEHGHLVSNLRQAIRLGLPPLEALASATVRPARLMGLRELGTLAPGQRADFFLTSDLATLPVERVFTGGREYVPSAGAARAEEQGGRRALPAVNLAVPPLAAADFTFPGVHGDRVCRVIRTNGANSLTTLEERVIHFDGGVPALDDDLALVGVWERHGRTGGKALGFLAGYGRLRGAVASTVAHDSHNLVALGTNPADLAQAANYLSEHGGGLAAVQGGEVRASVPLPVAGLLSDAPVGQLSRAGREFEATLREMGVTHQVGLAFLTVLALTTSPHVKLSDRGLVDVDRRCLLEVVKPEGEAALW